MKTAVTINNSTMCLSDVRLNQLNTLLTTPCRKWGASVSMCSRRTFDVAVNGGIRGWPTGYLKGFQCHDFEMLRNAMILEDLAYRAEIKEYGLSIMLTAPVPLSKADALFAPWLFSSKSPDEIANRLFRKKREVDYRMERMGEKLLCQNVESSRFNLCAALLNVGHLAAFQDTTTNFSAYEASLIAGKRRTAIRSTPSRRDEVTVRCKS